ncbi:MAG: ATP-binding protein [Ruminococcus sp.]|nr:ATP-binding protein [Ruminococcus sp.]
MGYSKSVYHAARELLADRKQTAEQKARRRTEEIYAKLPRVRELEKQISTAGIRAARAVVEGESSSVRLEKLRDENLALQRELSELLKSNGYSESATEPDYSCKKCGDTGFVESNGKTVMCQCFKQALYKCACDELNRTAPLSLSTFDSFSVDLYDKNTDPEYGLSPQKHMSKVLAFCKSYAEGFDKNSRSLLMTGRTGLGKTHLSLAIANEVIKKGFGVIYVSAPILMNRLEAAHFSKTDDNDAELLNVLYDCDLLIIDDLGTEFTTQFSVSTLYNIFNSRLLSGKPVIINTNLDLIALEKLYSERFVSRICGNAQKLTFIGKDIRVKKREF